MNLNLALVEKGVGVLRVGLKNFGVEFAGIFQLIFQDQQLQVVLLDLKIFGMVAIKAGVFGDGLVEVAAGVVEIAQHAVALGIIGEIQLGMTEELFSVGLAALGDVKAGKISAEAGILRIGG